MLHNEQCLYTTSFRNIIVFAPYRLHIITINYFICSAHKSNYAITLPQTIFVNSFIKTDTSFQTANACFIAISHKIQMQCNFAENFDTTPRIRSVHISLIQVCFPSPHAHPLLSKIILNEKHFQQYYTLPSYVSTHRRSSDVANFVHVSLDAQILCGKRYNMMAWVSCNNNSANEFTLYLARRLNEDAMCNNMRRWKRGLWCENEGNICIGLPGLAVFNAKTMCCEPLQNSRQRAMGKWHGIRA